MSKHTISVTAQATTNDAVTRPRPACTHRSHPAVCGQCQVDRWAAVGEQLSVDVVVLSADAYGDHVIETGGAQSKISIADLGVVALDVESTDPTDPFSASLCLTPDRAAALARVLLLLAAEARQDELNNMED